MQVREFQNPPFLDHFKRRKIVGSSNGLLCVETNEPSESRHSLFVWNPTIKEVTLVPETNIYRHSGFYGSCYSIGFGLCPSVNDYKIVITYCTENYVEMFKLYSLRSRSWKEVIYRFNTCYNCPGVTVNGVMFWKGLKIVGEDDGVYREEDYVNLCFSFDLAMELWTEIPIPDERPSTIWKWLSVYEEKLALLFGHKEFGHFVIHLWVMEEGVGASGKTWNWIKKYTSNPHPGLLYFATMWINEIFCGFWETEATEITAVLFNPTIKKIQELNIRECDNEHLISNYVESLVSIGGTRSFTKFPKRQG